MELNRAISYIFEDRNWLSKLLPLMLAGFASLIPVFGLIFVAAGAGYLFELAKNVRHGLVRPLPDWSNWQEKMTIGGQILIAIIVYNLPAVLSFACSYIVIVGIAGGFAGSSASLFVLCCTTPVLIGYSFISWCLLAIGISEFIETESPGRLYRIGHLWDVFRSQNAIVIQWAFYATLTNIVCGMIGAIPCIGWIAFFLFLYPLQGHLLGQFAHRLSISRQKNKPRMA